MKFPKKFPQNTLKGFFVVEEIFTFDDVFVVFSQKLAQRILTFLDLKNDEIGKENLTKSLFESLFLKSENVFSKFYFRKLVYSSFFFKKNSWKMKMF